MKQGENGWLLAGHEGSHEFVRAYFCRPKVAETEPRYVVKDNGDRLGPSHLWGMDLTRDGMELSWSCGRKSFIPAGWFQVTYRV